MGGIMKTNRLVLITLSIAALALLTVVFTSSVFAEPGTTFQVTASSDVTDALPGDGICETAPDNGMCTLRAAIMEANAHIGADTIYLPAAIYYLAIPGANEDFSATGDLDITESLTIIGDKNASTSIDANGLGDRVLQILPGAGQVSMSYLTIKNGSTDQHGGGVYSSAALNLSDVYIFKNHAAGYGGGLDVLAPLTMIGGNLEQNSSDSGGGIFAAGSLNMVNVLLANNSARLGGGLYLSSASGQLDHTNFVLNSASDSGGAIYNIQADLVLIESTLTSNSAIIGGGIFNGTATSLTLSRVNFFHNVVSDQGGGIQNEGGSVNGQMVLFDHNTSTDGSGSAVRNSSGSIDFDHSVFSNNEASYAGAISNFGVGYIANSTVISNTAYSLGGGIYNSGNLNLKGLTIQNNSCNVGAGIFNIRLLAVTNSTVSDNHSTSNAGGIFNKGTAFINSSTITRNTSSISQMTGFGGGIFTEAGSPVTLRNTILYDNHHMRGFSSVDDDCYGTLNTQHYNLIGTLSNCTLLYSQGLDLIGEDPLLGTLADNGGPTQTHALLEGSPAIDAGNPNGCFDQLATLLLKDQRGYSRTWDGDVDGVARCDIGAYEYASRVRLFLPVTLK
jgi:hypothetical protein